MERLFVYGTLAPGKPNAHVLRDVKGTWVRAFVKGTLLDEGWGAKLGYPGILLSKQSSVDEEAAKDTPENLVEGFLLSSSELSSHWNRLDEFEGSEYNRVQTEAILEDGTSVTAFVYCLVQNK